MVNIDSSYIERFVFLTLYKRLKLIVMVNRDSSNVERLRSVIKGLMKTEAFKKDYPAGSWSWSARYDIARAKLSRGRAGDYDKVGDLIREYDECMEVHRSNYKSKADKPRGFVLFSLLFWMNEQLESGVNVRYSDMQRFLYNIGFKSGYDGYDSVLNRGYWCIGLSKIGTGIGLGKYIYKKGPENYVLTDDGEAKLLSMLADYIYYIND